MREPFQKIEIPVDLPWDPPGSDLRIRLTDAYEEDGENCFYLAYKERDWHDHHASTALYVLSGEVPNHKREDLPWLRDKLRDAFVAHSDDWALSRGGRMDHCFEGDPGWGEEHAIVALQALWNSGPRVLPEPTEQ